MLRFLLAIAAAAAAFAQSADEKAWIAAKLYSTIQMHFAHAEGAPDFDLERDFREYVREAMAAPDRRAFSLATMRLFGKMRNGHSTFEDSWLWKEHGARLPFDLTPVDEGWIVVSSSLEGLEPGEMITSVDGEPIEKFYGKIAGMIPASSDAARRRNFGWSTILWPDKFTLGVASGKVFRADRGAPRQTARNLPQHPPAIPDNIGYIRIRSFSRAEFETAAIQAVRKHRNAPALIVDVRGNGGGSTPEKLLDALMDRPRADMSYTTPLHISHAGAQEQVGRAFSAEVAKDEYLKGYIQAHKEYNGARLLSPGVLHLPGTDPYKGRIVVLVDGYCASACEDFAMPMKATGRAVLVGEATFGSSGQPFLFDFGNGMRFRISTKRYYLPDGSPFEGVGIAPNVEVKRTAADMRSGRDSVLEKAIELATERGGGSSSGHRP